MAQELIEQGLGRKVLLRGDKGSDIGKIIDVGPNEALLSNLMDRYNSEIGVLPNEFYATPFEGKKKWIQNALKEGK